MDVLKATESLVQRLGLGQLVDKLLPAMDANAYIVIGDCWGTCSYHSDTSYCGPVACSGSTTLRWYVCQKYEYRRYSQNNCSAVYVGNVTMCGLPSQQYCGAKNCSEMQCY